MQVEMRQTVRKLGVARVLSVRFASGLLEKHEAQQDLLSKYRCGTFLCCMKGEHGAIANEQKRKNSGLTMTQESLLTTAIQQGSKPGQVWANWNNEVADAALARGEDPLQDKKAAGDGNAGACN